MASVTSVAASPATVAAHGGQSTITPVVSNPATTLTGAVYDDQGGSATVTVSVNPEPLTYSVDPAKKGVQGFIVLTINPTSAGSVAVGANGTSFVFTAA